MIINRRFSLIGLLVLGLMAFSSVVATITVIQAQETGPNLSIAENIPVITGEDVVVPLVLTSNENEVASTVFSIDFDEANLSFDDTDDDLDGVPDSVSFNIPAAFGGSVTYDPADTDGELDFAIFDGFPPISVMPDGTIVEITFTAIGVPGTGSTIVAPVVFSADPAASYGDVDAVDIPGTSSDGSVEISEEPVVEADLSVTKSDDPDPVEAGSQLTYTIEVTNNGPSDATGVVIGDILPAGVTFDSSDGSCVEDSGVVTCDIGELMNGASASVEIVVMVDEGTEGSTLTNTATVAGNEADPNGENDSATEDTQVAEAPEADLSVTKSDDPDPVEAGSLLTYTIEVTNNGPSDATGVVVSDTLPAGVTYDSSDGSCVEDSGVVTCDIGELANGASASFEIVVMVNEGTEGTTLTNTATVAGNEADPNSENNSADEDTQVAVETGVGLFIDPEFTIVPPNTIFELDILAKAGSQEVSGIQSFVNFDVTKLQVLDDAPGETGVQIQPGSALTDFIQTNSVDNTTGQVDFVAGNFANQSGFVDGDFVVATIRLRAIDTTEGIPTLVEFSTASPRQTIVSLSAEDVTGELHNGEVEIVEGADIEITFQFQGGARPKPAGWQKEVTVRFEPLVGGVERTEVITSAYDAAAQEAVINIPAVIVGTYDIFLTGPGTLTSVKRNVEVTVGAMSLDMGVLLSGNAINAPGESSEIINILDFTLLSDTFLKSEGDPEYDARADFDCNGVVNILDVGLLSINFLTQGPVEVP